MSLSPPRLHRCSGNKPAPNKTSRRNALAEVQVGQPWISSHDLSRADAIRKAKEERQAYVVWLQLRPNTFTGQTNVRQLRDPYIYKDGGKTYLLYAVAGETGIAIAEVSTP